MPPVVGLARIVGWRGGYASQDAIIRLSAITGTIPGSLVEPTVVRGDTLGRTASHRPDESARRVC
jgi:hypothetical protein